MVEQAAQLNRSSSASSVSESSVSSQDVPIVEGESTAPLFACLGPWGCWHSLLPPDESGIVHTACGLALGTASFTSNAPPHPLCRRRACVAARSQVWFVDLSTSVLRFEKFAQKCFCFAAAILRAFFLHALSACMLLHGCRSECISCLLGSSNAARCFSLSILSPARGPCLDFLEGPRC